jgi:hypothetical protein
MKGKINFDSYKNSGGADKVSAINYTGLELNKYDTVVISEGETDLSNYNCFNSANTYANKVISDYAWPKKNAIYDVTRTSTTSYPCEIYKRYNQTWFKYVTSGSKDHDDGAGFHYTNDGKVIYYNYEFNHNCLLIDNKFNFTTLPSYCIYLGTHHNKSYVINKNGGKIYEYDLATNTLISNILYTAGTVCYGTIVDGRIILSSNTTIWILKFDTDDSIKLENTTTSTNIYTRAITGTQLGDYMITSTTKSCQAINTPTSVGSLKCYRLEQQVNDGTYSYIEYTPKILENFTNQPCTINYNPRNGFLTLGTVDGVYLYHYDNISKTFTEIPLNLELPEKAETAMYRGCASPDGSEILVGTITSAGFSVKIYLTGYNKKVALLDDLENIGPKNYTAIVSETSLPRQSVDATAIIPYTANITFNVSPSANNLILNEGEN